MPRATSPSSVFYLRAGHVKLSVVSSRGKEAIVGMIGAGEFFGEGCLAGQRRRMGSAVARDDVTLMAIPCRAMRTLLHEQQAMSDLFIAKILARNIRVEEDLVDQLFNNSEKRLARTLLRLACYGQVEAPTLVVPAISQETLAEIVGTTRSRVNVFMQRFRKLGFIEGRKGIRVNPSFAQRRARRSPGRVRRPRPAMGRTVSTHPEAAGSGPVRRTFGRTGR